MEIKESLPKKFFEKERPQKDLLKHIIPFKFTNDENVRKGKYKDKVLITLAKGEK